MPLAAVNLDTYRILQRHRAVSLPQQLLPHCGCWGSNPYKMLPAGEQGKGRGAIGRGQEGLLLSQTHTAVAPMDTETSLIQF